MSEMLKQIYTWPDDGSDGRSCGYTILTIILYNTHPRRISASMMMMM